MFMYVHIYVYIVCINTIYAYVTFIILNTMCTIAWKIYSAWFHYSTYYIYIFISLLMFEEERAIKQESERD